MQKPTQALKSVKDPGDTFDFNPKWRRTLQFLIYFVEVKGISQAFNWLKCLGGFLHLKPTAGCQISTLIFEKKIMEGGVFFKYLSWYLTPYCGLQAQKPTQALKSIKGPGNTFDLSPLGISVKGIARTFNRLKCLGGFLHLKSTVGCQISTLIFDFFFMEEGSLLIFDTQLRAWSAETHSDS
jgi:hypothetical protein